MVHGPSATSLIVSLSSFRPSFAAAADSSAQTTEWLFLGIALLMLIARLHLRLMINHQRLDLSGFCLIIAWLASMSNACFAIAFLRLGILEPEMDISLSLVEDVEVLQRALRVSVY